MRLMMLSWIPVVCMTSVGAGCARDDQSACPSSPVEMTVAYEGETFGQGRLSLLPKGQSGSFEVKAVLLDPKTQEPMMQLQGPGSCQGGVIRARFGAGDAAQADARVLGGKFEGLYQPRLIEGDFFGAWTAEVVVKKRNLRQGLRGFLHQVPNEKIEGEATAALGAGLEPGSTDEMAKAPSP